MREQIVAKQAELQGDRWNLKNVIVYYRENLPASRLDSLVYSGAMKPAAAGARSGDPEEMTISDLNYFIANSGFGIRPAWVYETWWQKRIALFFATFVMIALCIPLATHFRRGGGLGALFAIGVGLGFFYFVVTAWPSPWGSGVRETLARGMDARPDFGPWRQPWDFELTEFSMTTSKTKPAKKLPVKNHQKSQNRDRPVAAEPNLKFISHLFSA